MILLKKHNELIHEQSHLIPCVIRREFMDCLLSVIKNHVIGKSNKMYADFYILLILN
jgi:hypothetical protein